MGYRTIEEFAAALPTAEADECEAMLQNVVEGLTMLASVCGTRLHTTVIGCTVLVTTEGGGQFAVTVLPADPGRRQ